MLNPGSIILPWRPIPVKWWSRWHHRIKQRQQQQACTRSTSLGVKWMDRAQGVWGLHASSCFSGRAVLIPFLLTSVGRDHWSSFSGCWTPCAKWSLNTSEVYRYGMLDADGCPSETLLFTSCVSLSYHNKHAAPQHSSLMRQSECGSSSLI